MSSLCEGYHWTVEQAMSITMPQAIMLNHASWSSRKDTERKFDAKREKEKKVGSPIERAEAKFIEDLPPERLSVYMSQMGNSNW